MSPEERDPAYLWDMLESARDALRILGDISYEEFAGEDEEIVRLAVERKLEILGEAAGRISKDFRSRNPEIPWKDIVGLRNIISHQYEKVDYEEVYRICREDLPALIQRLSSLVPPVPKGNEQGEN